MDATRPLTAAVLFALLSGCASDSNDEAPDLSSEERKADIYYVYGTQALQQQKYTEALDHLLKAQDLSPKESRIHNNLGMAYYFKGRSDKALEELSEAVRLDPKNSDAKNNMASVYLNQGNNDKARELYNQVSQDLVYAHQYRVKYNLALIALKERKQPQAMELLRKSVEEREDYCPSHFLMGKIQASMENYQQALQHYKDASTGTCTNSPAPLAAQGEIFIHLGDFDRARLKYRDLKERFPTGPYADLADRQLRQITLDERRTQHQDVSADSGSAPMAPQF